MPAASAACGSRLVSVRPGIACASSTCSSPSSREDHVDAREAVAAEQPEDRDREVLRVRGDLVRQVGRAHELGLADLVARLEVVEVLLLGLRLDHRQRLHAVVVLEQRDRQLAPLDVALEQHAVVVAERRDQRLRDVRRPSRANLMPSAEPCAAGLTTTGNPSRSSIAGSASPAPSSLKAISLKAKKSGVGRPSSTQHVLRQHLVHAAHAAEHARAGVGHADDLQQLLHRAVLAAAAVQCDERDIGLARAQVVEERSADVDRDEVDAEPLERVLDTGSRAQRDLALERRAALEQRDAPRRHEPCARRSPPRRGSSHDVRERLRRRTCVSGSSGLPVVGSAALARRSGERGEQLDLLVRRPSRSGARPRRCRRRRRPRS